MSQDPQPRHSIRVRRKVTIRNKDGSRTQAIGLPSFWNFFSSLKGRDAKIMDLFANQETGMKPATQTHDERRQAGGRALLASGWRVAASGTERTAPPSRERAGTGKAAAAPYRATQEAQSEVTSSKAQPEQHRRNAAISTIKASSFHKRMCFTNLFPWRRSLLIS